LASRNINRKPFCSKYPDQSQTKYTKQQAKIKLVFKGTTKFAGAFVNDAVSADAGKKKGR